MARVRRTRPEKVRLWRWRRNPLRRRSDRVEAWIVLAGWILALLGGLWAGRATALSVDHALASRRAEVHAAAATLLEDAPKSPPPDESGISGDTVWAKVRWRAADGSTHQGRAKVGARTPAGTRVTVWTDRTGRPASKPPTATEAQLQAAFGGALVALGTGGAVLAGGHLARGRLQRRRLAEWDAEWARIGPQWSRRMNG
jgi:hypothetical protein